MVVGNATVEKSVVATESIRAQACHDRRMDHSGYDELPRAYRIGLRLHALGADDDLIADCLEIDPGGVGTLLDIGARKLEQIETATGAIDRPTGVGAPKTVPKAAK